MRELWGGGGSRWGTQSKLSLEVNMWQHISHAWNFVVLATRITVLCLSKVESDMLLTLQFIWDWGRNISFGQLSKTKASQQHLIYKYMLLAKWRCQVNYCHVTWKGSLFLLFLDAISTKTYFRHEFFGVSWHIIKKTSS